MRCSEIALQNQGVETDARFRASTLSRPLATQVRHTDLMRGFFCVLIATVAAVGSLRLEAADLAVAAPDIHDQVTFLYFADLTAPRRFYGTVLGLSHYYETPWVTLYRSSPGATIGIVKRDHDIVAADTKRDAVMLSIVTNDVDSWYQRLKRGGLVRFEKDLYDHRDVPIRAFLIRDPAGYSIEFFQWRKGISK